MTDMRLDKLPNINAYVNDIAKFEIAFPCPVLLMVHNALNFSDPISPPIVCERCGEEAEQICNTCNHAYCCKCRDHHTCAIIETNHTTPRSSAPNAVTDVTWRMPVGYNNGSKGHQAPSHEASSEGKSASNNVDGVNTDGTTNAR